MKVLLRSVISTSFASGISAIKLKVLGTRFHIRFYFPSIIHQSNLISIIAARCGKSVSQKLQKFQNRAVRVITFSSYDRSTDELFRMV